MLMKCNGCPVMTLGLILLLGAGTAAGVSYFVMDGESDCHSCPIQSFFGSFFSRSTSCTPIESVTPPPSDPEQQAQDTTPVKKAELGKNVFLEVQGEKADKRRVVVQGYVCLRQGPLEQLLTRKFAKEHEAILAADVDASVIHAALVACGAKPGHPVRFQPKFEPATGSVIKITLEYKVKDKIIRVPAQQWIRDKTGKDLNHDWVFAGSVLFPDPENKGPAFYGANQGDVICVCNMETALLDLPIDSTKVYDDRFFEAHTERIPAEGTPVLIILEPVLENAKK